MTITRPDAYRLLSVAPFDMVVFGGTGDLTRGETPPFSPELLKHGTDGLQTRRWREPDSKSRFNDKAPEAKRFRHLFARAARCDRYHLGVICLCRSGF
jgi:hypothetical protein